MRGLDVAPRLLNCGSVPRVVYSGLCFAFDGLLRLAASAVLFAVSGLGLLCGF